jgi:hypothetical protein
MDKKDLYKARLDAIQQKAQLANDKAKALVEKTEKLKNGIVDLAEKIAEETKNKSVK